MTTRVREGQAESAGRAKAVVLEGLRVPAQTSRVLGDFVAASAAALGDDLRSIVLYGSAAEGRLRPTSDVNVILVLRRASADRLAALRDPLRLAQAAIRLTPMLMLESEIDAAVRSFAVKFHDILVRRQVLYGDDPFRAVSPPREAALVRVRQVLLNLAMRLRQQYVTRGAREEQLWIAVAEGAGPLRSSAFTLLSLEGESPSSPREALIMAVRRIPPGDWEDVLDALSRSREEGRLPPGTAGPTLLRLAELAAALRDRAEALSER